MSLNEENRRLMKKSFWRETAWLYSPLLLCAGIMLPRLLSPQFGFFDDAVSLTTAQKVWSGQWSLGPDVNGRFRPIYYLYYAFLALLFDNHPFWFFLGNLVLWLAATFCLICLARGLGLDRRAAWLAGFTFVISGPVLENIYTLSKPELLQALLILLLLLACGLYSRLKTRTWKVGLFLMMASLAFLACSTKETGVLLAPAALFSVAITWASSRLTGQPGGPTLRQRLVLWWSSLGGVVLYSVVSLNIMNRNPVVPHSGFLQYDLSWIIGQARLLWGWLRRDYLHLLPVGLVALLAVFQKPNRAKLILILECLGWLALWMGIFLPWRYFPEYYLYPAALSAALMCGAFFALALTLLSAGPIRRFLAWAGLGLSGLLLLLTLPSQVANGRLQLAFDRANAKMLAYVVEQAPQGSTVWININPPNEYVAEFKTWVNQLNNRPDLQVDYFHSQDLADALSQSAEVWIVSPFMENQFYPSVRVGMSELPTREWNASLEKYLTGQGELVGEVRESFRSSDLDTLRLFCPLARSFSFCKVPNAPLDRRTFAYGWKIIRVP